MPQSRSSPLRRLHPTTTVAFNVSDPERPRRRDPDICAKLTTYGPNNEREAIHLKLDEPVRIGRDPKKCTYVIPQDHISGIHCEIHVVRSPSEGGIIVSCQDKSRNGILWNGHRIRKSQVILSDGDVLEIPRSLKFTCTHIWKDPHEKGLFGSNRSFNERRLPNFVITSNCLGKGSFAEVWLALDIRKPVQIQVACKTITMRRETEHSQVKKEVKILKEFNHPNVTKIFADVRQGNMYHIFLQLCTGGDLFMYISSIAEKRSHLCEAEVKYLTYQLLLGLQYLHHNALAHRGPYRRTDLKVFYAHDYPNLMLTFEQPENILLFAPGTYPRLLIADFGLARPNAHEMTLNVCGTVSYLPPEGIIALDCRKLGYTGMPADCWSLGVIIYVMLTFVQFSATRAHPLTHPSNTHPFEAAIAPAADTRSWLEHVQLSRQISMPSPNYARSEDLLKLNIIEGNVHFKKSIWMDLDDGKPLKFLISQLLNHDPEHRAKVEDALTSAWIISELEELKALYHRRITMELSPVDA
ncbi:kinase-like protein [Flagelloscypha sp. PMI_526]|nr:kinase-like protein [Flagelloscypha sp. PMI_526]